MRPHPVFPPSPSLATPLTSHASLPPVATRAGYDGAIATNEAYIYALDSLPLFIGLGVYTWFYPPRFLPNAVIPSGAHVELGQRSPDSGRESKRPLYN